MNIELCKLTTQDLKTHNGFQWEVDVWAPELSGDDELCSSSWYHCYEHPLLAALLNLIHADITNPRLWKIETAGDFKTDNGLKRGYRSMRLIEEIELPVITTDQRIAFGILCVLEVYKESSYVEWANNWLSGNDRTAAASAEASAVAAAAARAAARAAVNINLIELAQRAINEY